MKRFTETEKWRDPWFRRLAPKIKLLWLWMLDHCDHAGVIDIDFELVSFQLGEDVTKDDIKDFGGRVLLRKGKYWIPKFVQFQYGQLSYDCKPHKPVYAALRKHAILLEEVQFNHENDSLSKATRY